MKFFFLALTILFSIAGEADTSNCASCDLHSAPGGIRAAASAFLSSIAETAKPGMRAAAAAIEDVSSGVRSALGSVSDCEINQATGWPKLRCTEVQAADASSFRANYNYSGLLERNGSCGGKEPGKVLEGLHLSDIAQMTSDSLECSLPLLDSFARSPGSPVVQRLKNTAFENFGRVKSDLAALLQRRETAQAHVEISRNMCSRADGPLAPSCADQIMRADTLRTKEIPELNAAIDSLVAQIPFGTEARMKETLFEMARRENVNQAGFAAGYSGSMLEIEKDFKQFHLDLLSTKNDGKWFSSDSPNVPLMRKRLMESPVYNQLLEAKSALSPKVKELMMCRQNAEFVKGSQRLNAGLIAGSVLSVAVTGGMSLAGVGLTGAARLAFVAADLAMVGVDGALIVGQIYDSCYANVSVAPTGRACTPEQGLNAVLKKTETAQCATNVVAAAAPGVIVAGSLAVKAAGRGTRAPSQQPDIPPASTPDSRSRPIPLVDQKTRLSLRDKQALDEVLRRNLRPGETVDTLHDRMNASDMAFEAFLRTRVSGVGDKLVIRDIRSKLLKERRQLAANQTEVDLQQVRLEGTATNLECAKLNRIWANPPFEPSARCSLVKFTKASDRYCSCGKAKSIGRWLIPCPKGRKDYFTPSEFADLASLPANSDLQLCRKVLLPPGTECLHGGLGPTMSGYGGAAQIICSAYMDSAVLTQLPGSGVTLTNASPPPIEVTRVAVMHEDSTITDLMHSVSECMNAHLNRCPPMDVARIRANFWVYVNGHKSVVSPADLITIEEYFKYASGKMRLDARGGFVPNP